MVRVIHYVKKARHYWWFSWPCTVLLIDEDTFCLMSFSNVFTFHALLHLPAFHKGKWTEHLCTEMKVITLVLFTSHFLLDSV